MKHEIIEEYLNNILTPQLTALGVSGRFIKTVTTTIRNQIHSCIYYWDIEQFRKGLLTVGSEEGLFYKPAADNDIRNFVVLTIRNSELEWLQTDNYALAGLNSNLDDSCVKPITSAAIGFFKDKDFVAIAEQLEEPTHDVYGDVSEKYPAAFHALVVLGNVDKTVIGYKRVEKAAPPNLEILPMESKIKNKLSSGERSDLTYATTDGISFSIDPNLLEILKRSAKKRLPFVSDSFKSVSRNIEKLLLIMEYVLRHDIPFVTANYFITDHYIERRASIVRAGHDRDDMIRNWKNNKGLGEHHQYALKWASDGLK